MPAHIKTAIAIPLAKYLPPLLRPEGPKRRSDQSVSLCCLCASTRRPELSSLVENANFSTNKYPAVVQLITRHLARQLLYVPQMCEIDVVWSGISFLSLQRDFRARDHGWTEEETQGVIHSVKGLSYDRPDCIKSREVALRRRLNQALGSREMVRPQNSRDDRLEAWVDLEPRLNGSSSQNDRACPSGHLVAGRPARDSISK